MRTFISNFANAGALTLLMVFASIASGFGQTAPGAGRIIIKGGAVQILPQPQLQPVQVVQTTPDAFDQMVASAASFDMDAPVEAQAEFDPPVASVGSRIVYRLTVSALDESLHVPEKLPLPDGLELRAGGRGQTYQPSGNQKLRPITTVIFRGIVTKTGTIKIPSFELTAYGKPVKVPETSLTVLPAGSVTVGDPPRVFLDLPEGDCYVGQLLRVSLILPMPSDGRILGSSQPHINGEFIFSEQVPLGMRLGPIQRDGKTFSASVQEVMITPLRAGAQELIGQTHGFIMRPNPAQTNLIQTFNQLVDSDPVTLDVKPLPTQGQLPGFTGAVGIFQIDTPRLSSREIHAGEPVTMTVTIRGDGNIGRITPPPFPSLPNWEGFPPLPDPAPSGIILQRGFAEISYTLIPLDAQSQATPPILFSYFDPKRKIYTDLTIPSVPLKVLPSPLGSVPKTAADSAAPSAPLEENEPQEKEPVFGGLMEKPGASAHSLVPLQQRWWFFGLQIVPAGIVGGLWAWDRRRRFLEQHPEVILKRRARRGLRRELRLARRAASARDGEGFVVAAANALREACAPHSASHPQALVCADVLQELPVAEQQGSVAEMIRRLFAAADAMRFGGPARDSSELLKAQLDLEQVLEELRGRL